MYSLHIIFHFTGDVLAMMMKLHFFLYHYPVVPQQAFRRLRRFPVSEKSQLTYSYLRR